MIIGLDIDDTITRHPEFFSFLSHNLIEAGHQVVIITFREDRENTKEFLEQNQIAYSKLVTSILESNMEYGVYEWKSAMCKQHGVEIFFEDDPNVLKHIEESTVCMMPVRTKTLSAVR